MPKSSAPLSFFAKIRKYAIAHKITSAIVAVVVIGGVYWEYARLTAAPATTLYVLSTVQKGTITSSVTGSGQVQASDQVTINPKASGQITAVYVHDGQQVVAGQALAQIDSTTAFQALQNAQGSLQSSQIALAKLQQPATQLSMTQAQNALASAQDSVVTNQTNLTKAYQTGYNDASTVYLDLPNIMTSLGDIINGTKASHGIQSNIDYYEASYITWEPNAGVYHDNANTSYKAAVDAYNKALADYQATSQTSSTSTVVATIAEAYSLTQTVATALSDTNTFVNDYETVLKGRNLVPNVQADQALTNLASYISTMNNHLSTLLNDQNAITADQQAIVDAQRSIVADQQSLAQLVAGANPLDVQSQQLAIQQQQNAVLQAQQTLANYTIRAPFSGTLGSVSLSRGQTVGSGTAVAVEVSTGDIADLLLNEVDAAKVAAGDKVSLTFDAINGLTIAGHVASISPVGTVTQGVVSYDIKIAFDTEDGRVKSGMTVNAAIITAIKTDTLMVPSSAIKTSGGNATVQVVANPPTQTTGSAQAEVTLPSPPQSVVVTTGISSDTQTEVLSGLTEGQTIVTRTVASTAATTQSASAPSLFGNTGGTRGVTGGGGGARTTPATPARVGN